MIDDQNFTIDPEQAAGEPSARGAAPKVVVVYRNGSLSSTLLPPVLILLCALLILSHQRRTPIRVFAPSALSVAIQNPEPAPTPAPPKPSEPVPPARQETPGPAKAEPAPEAPAEPPVAARSPEPAAEPPARPEEPERPEPKHKDRTAIVSDLPRDPEPAGPDPAVTREQALADIRREAEEREAEIQRLEDLQPVARQMQIAESYRRVQASRLPFHAALRDALRAPEPKRADAVASVCDSFGRSVPEEIRQKVNRMLKTSHATISRNAKIDTMRAWGLPEAMILDFLAHDTERMLGTRGGPRNEDEVLVWAARTLLTLPPRPQSASQKTRPQARAVPRTSPAPRPRFP